MLGFSGICRARLNEAQSRLCAAINGMSATDPKQILREEERPSSKNGRFASSSPGFIRFRVGQSSSSPDRLPGDL